MPREAEWSNAPGKGIASDFVHTSSLEAPSRSGQGSSTEDRELLKNAFIISGNKNEKGAEEEREDNSFQALALDQSSSDGRELSVSLSSGELIGQKRHVAERKLLRLLKHDGAQQSLREAQELLKIVNVNWHRGEILRTAIDYNALEIVELLLRRQELEVGNELSEGLIRVASWKRKCSDMASLLLGDRRCDPNYRENAALLQSVSHVNEDLLMLLLYTERTTPGAYGNKALCKACRKGYKEVARLLLEFGKDIKPFEPRNKPLILAASHGRRSIVRMLLDQDGVDPSASSNQAIRDAALHGHEDVVELLINDGRCDPSALSQAALKNAASRGHLKVVKALVRDKRVNVSCDDFEAICRAMRNKHPKVAQFLAREGRVRLQQFKDDPRVLRPGSALISPPPPASPPPLAQSKTSDVPLVLLDRQVVGDDPENMPSVVQTAIEKQRTRVQNQTNSASCVLS